MPSDVKEAPGHRIRGVAPGELALPALDPALAKLAANASNIRTRKGQSIGLTLDGHEAAYIVRAGGPHAASRGSGNATLVRDFRALARLTPAARSLAETHQHRRGDGLDLFA